MEEDEAVEEEEAEEEEGDRFNLTNRTLKKGWVTDICRKNFYIEETVVITDGVFYYRWSVYACVYACVCVCFYIAVGA